MTGEEFKLWLDAMMSKGLATNKLDIARQLGRSDQWVSDAQRKGCDRVTALACAALYAGLEPFTSAAAA